MFILKTLKWPKAEIQTVQSYQISQSYLIFLLLKLSVFLKVVVCELVKGSIVKFRCKESQFLLIKLNIMRVFENPITRLSNQSTFVHERCTVNLQRLLIQFLVQRSSFKIIMNIKTIQKFLISTRKIRDIPYRHNNKSMLPKALQLSPNKQLLSSIFNKQLTEICPDVISAKKCFVQKQNNVQDLYSYIREKILNEQDPELDKSFFQRAHYYFLKQGKKIRPLMILNLADNFKQILKRQNPQINFDQIDADIKKWCALIQIMHIASLAHDDIVDDSPSRRGQQSQHLKYGSKIAVFSGNYIIAKASKTVSQFNSGRLYQIYANTMASLAQGQIKQLVAKKQNAFVNNKKEKLIGFDEMMDRYMEKTFFKSAALMCGSLFGVPTIFQLNLGKQFPSMMNKSIDQIQQISFRIGQHYGLALQLIDDILDYVSTAQQMGKQQMSDLVQGNVTAPVYLTYRYSDQIEPTGNGINLQLLNKRKKTKQDALIVKKWVEKGVGIQLTYILGALHLKQGLQQLKTLNLSEQDLLAWRYLGYRLMTRRK